MSKSKVTPAPPGPQGPQAPPKADESQIPALTPAGALRVAHLAVEGILWRAESERYARDDVRKDLGPVSQMLLDTAWMADGYEGNK